MGGESAEIVRSLKSQYGYHLEGHNLIVKERE